MTRGRCSHLAVSAFAGAIVIGVPRVAKAGETPALVDARSATVERATPENGSPTRFAALGGIGFPRPLAIEGLIGIERTLAVGAEYSFLPNMTIGGVDTTYWAFAGDARFFAFRGPFFVGVRGGRQHIGATATVSVPSYGAVFESFAIDTWFVNPRVGVLWMYDSWLAFGLEAGLQIPLASHPSTSLPEALAADRRATNVTNVANTLGNSVLPTIDLLRLGLTL